MTKTPKYNAAKTVIDNIKFDSKIESKCYEIIKASNLDFGLQPSFELQSSFKRGTNTIRAIVYKGDFKVIFNNKEYIIDVKGIETPVFKIKVKMLYKRYPDILFYKIKSQKEMRELLIQIVNNSLTKSK